MADLEGAATDTLAALRELGEQAEEAQQALSRLEVQARDLSTHLEEGWGGLVERSEAFLEHVHEQQETLAEEANGAGTALSQLSASLADARGEAEAELSAAARDTVALGEQVTAAAPTVAAMKDSVDALFAALGEQAREVEEELAAAVDEARQFLESQAEGLHALQDEIDSAAEAVCARLDECEETLRWSLDEWSRGLDQVEGQIQDAFAAAATHLGASVAMVIDAARAACQESGDGLAAAAEETCQALGEVAAVAESSAEAVVAGTAAHRAAMEETEGSLEQARARLGDVTAVLAAYTFVTL